MPKMYEDGIARGKDKTFVIYQRADGRREEISYNDILRESDKLIDVLRKAGLRKGDRIGVISSLRPYWYALSYTCLREGYIMTCIDPGVPIKQMQHMLLETEVRAVFTSLNNVHLPKELDKYIPVYSVDKDFPLINNCKKVNFLLGNASKLPKDTFYVLFSSGTTGENRKAVLLKHDTVTLGIEYGMSKDAGIYKKTSAYTVRQRDLMLFPPYHIAGLLCATYDIYCNTQVIMLERLTPNALMSVLQELKPDNICTVPSMLSSLYKKIQAGYQGKPLVKLYVNNALRLSGFLRKNFGSKIGLTLLKPINKQAFGGNIKGFMIGASPFDPVANKFFLDMGIDVSMAYGLTELGAPLAVTGQGYYPGTTGRVLRHTKQMDIRIVNKDETGRGEVEILSPYRMISYMNEKDNEGCFTDDGYFKSGDLGYFDSNKCLVICGRIKESIVLRNGEKLLPEEIESKYQNLDCVKEIVAFKVPGQGGCDDFAIALIKDKTKGIPDEPMKERVYERAEHLPQMYRPKDVYVLKEFPLSSSHKVQRFRLTEMAINGETEPITDASMIPVDEDETTADLRKILVEVGGTNWKTEKLTQGLLLNLDSLSTVNLYVAIEEKWNIDLFQSSSQPETFGELLDIIKNFNAIDKNEKEDLDLSKYPLKTTAINRFACNQLERLVKQMYHVKGLGLMNIPKEGNFLMCSNHRTELDPAFIYSCLTRKQQKKTCIVGKAELATDKLLKHFVVSHNFIPIDRTGNSIQTLDRCRELLLQGWNIIIFPEGTNVQNHEGLFEFREGAARLAITTNKPIIPIHITGVGHQKHDMSNFNLPSIKSRIRVRFGKPFEPNTNDVQELNKILKKKIEEL